LKFDNWQGFYGDPGPARFGERPGPSGATHKRAKIS
jgi:hypothetical protein